MVVAFLVLAIARAAPSGRGDAPASLGPSAAGARVVRLASSPVAAATVSPVATARAEPERTAPRRPPAARRRAAPDRPRTTAAEPSRATRVKARRHAGLDRRRATASTVKSSEAANDISDPRALRSGQVLIPDPRFPERRQRWQPRQNPVGKPPAFTAVIFVPQRGHASPPRLWTERWSRTCFSNVGGTRSPEQLDRVGAAWSASPRTARRPPRPRATTACGTAGAARPTGSRREYALPMPATNAWLRSRFLSSPGCLRIRSRHASSVSAGSSASGPISPVAAARAPGAPRPRAAGRPCPSGSGRGSGRSPARRRPAASRRPRSTRRRRAAARRAAARTSSSTAVPGRRLLALRRELEPAGEHRVDHDPVAAEVEVQELARARDRARRRWPASASSSAGVPADGERHQVARARVSVPARRGRRGARRRRRRGRAARARAAIVPTQTSVLDSPGPRARTVEEPRPRSRHARRSGPPAKVTTDPPSLSKTAPGMCSDAVS